MPKAQPGDKIAVLSPSFAAPGARRRSPVGPGAAASRSCSGSSPPDGSDVLDGAILLLETSEMLIPAQEFGWILRAMGERGLLERVAGVLVARPPTSDHAKRPSSEERARLRAEQRDTAIEMVGRYNLGVPIVVGPPFGHTKPQWILPHGGEITIDGAARRLFADYR